MKTSKVLSFILCALLWAAGVSAQPGSHNMAAELLWQKLEQGETERAFWSLVDIYRRNGADIAETGEWKLNLHLQDYQEIVNQYSNPGVVIRLSRMTNSETEAADYWENWSRVLAKGNFDHKKFFVNDRERYLMANYNALVMAAHEIGHYLDFRYKMSDRDFGDSGMLRTNAPLNCSEGYADRFAVGMVNYLAEHNASFRRMRPRYLELIKHFNSVVPPENRYNLATYESISDEKCGAVDLHKNGIENGEVNENFFRQYASAYFNRHRLMLENPDYPSLPGVIERDLLKPFFSRIDYSARRLSVRTLAEYPGNVRFEIWHGGNAYLRDSLETASSPLYFNPEHRKTNAPVKLGGTILNERGEVRHAEIGWTARKILNETDQSIFKENEFFLKLLGADEKIMDSFKIRVPKNLKSNFVFSKIVLPTDNDLLLVLTPFDAKRNFNYVVVLYLSKTAGKWQSPRFVKFTLPGVASSDELTSTWFAAPGGKLNLLRKQEVKNSDAVKLTLYEIDYRSAKLPAKLKRPAFDVRMKTKPKGENMKKGLWRNYSWEIGVFGNEAGELFLPGSEANLQLGYDANLFEIKEPEARAVLGNLDGIRDGDDPRRIQISTLFAARFIDEKRVIFIDGFGGKRHLREIVFR